MRDSLVSFLVLSAALHAALLMSPQISTPRGDVQPSQVCIDVVFDVEESISADPLPDLPPEPKSPIEAPEPMPVLEEIEDLLPIDPPTDILLPIPGSDIAPETTAQPDDSSSEIPPAPLAIVETAVSAHASNRPPIYPWSARRSGHQGLVVLDIEVGTEGEVMAVTVNTSSGYADLDREAVRAVRNWRFDPATKGGTAVVGKSTVPIRFMLVD